MKPVGLMLIVNSRKDGMGGTSSNGINIYSDSFVNDYQEGEINEGDEVLQSEYNFYREVITNNKAVPVNHEEFNRDQKFRIDQIVDLGKSIHIELEKVR